MCFCFICDSGERGLLYVHHGLVMFTLSINWTHGYVPSAYRKLNSGYMELSSARKITQISWKQPHKRNFTYTRVPQCLSLVRFGTPPRNQRGGHTRLRGRGGVSQFGRLEKKPSTLSTLCREVREPVTPNFYVFQYSINTYIVKYALYMFEHNTYFYPKALLLSNILI